MTKHSPFKNKRGCIISYGYIPHTKYTTGTADGPGGRDQTLAVKTRKLAQKSVCFRKKIKTTQKIYIFCIYLLVMPKYWGKQIPRSGSKAKDAEKKEKEKKKKKETERW